MSTGTGGGRGQVGDFGSRLWGFRSTALFFLRGSLACRCIGKEVSEWHFRVLGGVDFLTCFAGLWKNLCAER